MDSNDFSLQASVRKQICEYIDNMNLAKGTRLPSEVKLAEMLQVSRATVRSVLADLTNEGRVIRRHGSGTFVNTYTEDIKATLFPSMQYYWDIIKDSGYTPDVKLISSRTITNRQVAAALRLPPDTKLVFLERTYSADGKPCIICRDYFDVSIIKDKKAFRPQASHSIFQILYESAGRTIIWSQAYMVSSRYKGYQYQVHKDLAKYFDDASGNSAKPLLAFCGVCYDKKDLPFLYTDSFFDTDLIGFSYIQQYGTGRRKDNLED